MERKNQNVEYSKNMCETIDNCLDTCDNTSLYKHMRVTSASGGDVAIPNESLHCNSKNSIVSGYSRHSDEHYDDEVVPLNDCHHSSSSHSQLIDVEPQKSVNIVRKQQCAGGIVGANITTEVGSKLKAELSKYKKELKEYNNTTKDLEEKYLKINYELSEMQEKHDRFIAKRRANTTNESESYTDDSTTTSCTSSSGSEYSLKRKYTQVFTRNSSIMGTTSKSSLTKENRSPVPPRSSYYAEDDYQVRRHRKKTVEAQRHTTHTKMQHRPLSKRKSNETKENAPPMEAHKGGQTHQTHSAQQQQQTTSLKDIYKVLKTVLDTNQKSPSNHKGLDIKELQNTIANLQTEQAKFRSIIQQQQTCLNDYHTRCVKAQHIMQTQQREIEKLSNNNHQLESEINEGIDKLRSRIDCKLKDVSQLPQLMRNEQSKSEKMAKENSILTERLAKLQHEASTLKLRIEELGRRKNMTLNRLKATERDLKIFKNYNTALKHEKRKLADELIKVKQQLEAVQNNSKRTMARQREQSENKRRELQKRVFELELRLSRSQNSTTNLIQERDSLIAELQTQLNTLVHNFEVSQKHIRVLRRHIYQMTSGGNTTRNSPRIMSENP